MEITITEENFDEVLKNNAGVDDVSITSIIGHSDVAFTKRQYANQQTDQLERGIVILQFIN